MKLSRCFLAGLGAFAGMAAHAIERLPIEDFARTPTASRARLSPDGKRLAFLRDYAGRATMHFLDIDKGQLSQLDLGEAGLIEGATKSAWEFHWTGDKRVVIMTTVWGDVFYGLVAVDWNGAQPVAISGYEDNKIEMNGSKLFANEIVHLFRDQDQNILLLDRHEGEAGRADRPNLLKVDTLTGAVSRAVKNPGDVSWWGIDLDGVARLGVLERDDSSGAIYRENEKAPWRTILPLDNQERKMRPYAVDAATGRIYVSALNQERRWAVVPLDPATGALGEPLLTDPVYDVAPTSEITPSIDGIALETPIFSARKRELAGIRYYTESARVKWFDREFAGYQALVDRSLPDTVNLLVDESMDGKRTLWFSYSDQNPGMYSLLDGEKRSFKQLARVRNGINPALMAQTLVVKYPARDGLVIHGYLTVPVGHGPKGLPLVVMPHGGPWVRDVWGFDPLVQLLANRGYAILQMDYRGSTGYGYDLYRKARRQIGGKIQDDIEDGTHWAIAAGVADPQHVAIMGFSYGGYSTLFALERSPDLYRCGISGAGPADWQAMFEDSDVSENAKAKRYWQSQIGDPSKGELKAISPVNFADKIRAPVLIIQGKRDERVPVDQAKRMIAALEKAGNKPESLFLPNVAHNYGDEKDRILIYRTIVAFLEKNLGPGVP